MGERIASWFAIALMLGVLGTSYWYGQQLRATIAGESGRIGAIDFFAENIALTGFDAQGRPRYRLFADRMTHYASSDDVDMIRPRLLSMRADQPRVETTAESAHAQNNGETIQMHGNVTLTRAAAGRLPSLRMYTDTLSARPDEDRLWTDAPVRMESGHTRLQAHGMEYDNVARRVLLRADVVGSFPARSRQ